MMQIFSWRSGVAALALAALSGCQNVSTLDCNEIAEHAKRISQNEAVKIQTVENVRETARAENEAKCEGNATMSDGSTGTLYLRAYEENGNTMVAYQGTPF
jgi:outer membrane lipoprotein SlyB